MRPILKKNWIGQQRLKNYRPVSNLPLLSKVLERLVLKQLLSYLAQNDLNEMFQQPIESIIAQKPLYYVFVTIF